MYKDKYIELPLSILIIAILLSAEQVTMMACKPALIAVDSGANPRPVTGKS
jgi:hypothetical protein